MTNGEDQARREQAKRTAEDFKVPHGYTLLPIVPTMDMLLVLRNRKWPETWERGKRMQIRYGLDVVPPECNIEIAAGCYEQLIEAAPQPPDGAIFQDRARLERALDALKAFQPGYERPDANDRKRLYESRNDAIHALEEVLRGLAADGVRVDAPARSMTDDEMVTALDSAGIDIDPETAGLIVRAVERWHGISTDGVGGTSR